MNRIRSLSILIVVAVMGIISVTGVAAQVQRTQQLNAGPRADIAAPSTGSIVSTTFTYQGLIKQSGSPINGSCDLSFRLFDAASTGAQIGSATTRTLSITNGLFTASLNFGDGSVFAAEARWLDIRVRCPTGSGGFTTLSPRQALTAAPLALALPGLRTEPNATSPNIIGGHSSNTVTGLSFGSVIGGGGSAGFPNSIDGAHSTIAGGSRNKIDGSDDSFIGGGFSNTVTAASHEGTIGGGGNNSVSGDHAAIFAGINNTTYGDESFIGGGSGNTASGTGSFVGGGGTDGTNSFGNRAQGSAATISGGVSNTIASNVNAATIGGGFNNTANGAYSVVSGGRGNSASSDFDAVGGGDFNHATGGLATVSGGSVNHATGIAATVSGGSDNNASGFIATIPGGWFNSATMSTTLAAGYRAKANHAGTFVWADSTNADFASTANNQFLIRANGGVGIGTNSPDTQLHVVKSANGSGTTPADNVAVFENPNTNNSADVLALKIGMTTNPAQSNNYVTFLDGNNISIGAIQGNNAGSVEYVGAGNDYAEYLPRANVNEVLKPGDIVGVSGGQVSSITRGASQVMVVSTGPIVVGNDPGEAARANYERVVFIGQVDVQVRGVVHASDFIVPSGLNDGTGIAVAPASITADQFAQVVGQAWESSSDVNLKSVRVAIGLTSANPFVKQQQSEIKTQQQRIDQLQAQVAQLKTDQSNSNAIDLGTLVGLNLIALNVIMLIGAIVFLRRRSKQGGYQ